jgi:ankyrin repeat protein
MSFLKRLFGVKESLKADIAERESTPPSSTSNSQPSPSSQTTTGAPTNNTPSFGDPAVFREGNLEKVSALLKDNPGLVFDKDNEGKTPLHWAAFNGRKDMAELLLANKADVDSKDNNGQTPLHYAASFRSFGLRFSRVQLVELLLANKANVDSRDNNGYTPLRAAAVRGHKDVEALLRHHGGHE